MATVQTKIINRALRLLGVLAEGESPTTTMSNDALTALNAMVDAWNTEYLTLYATENITITLDGSASYTIGATGDVVASAAPISIDSAFITVNSVDYPISEMTQSRYDSLVSKSLTSQIPTDFVFNSTHPDATVTFYPVPDSGNVVTLRVNTLLSAFTLTQTFSMPNGYENALVFNLAVDMSPEYPAIALNPLVLKNATMYLAKLKRLNRKAIIEKSPLVSSKRGRYNINTDI
jgi:hypothetical protein